MCKRSYACVICKRSCRSVYFAIRDAVSSVRIESGLDAFDFRIDVPATYERIRMACADECTKAAVAGGIDHTQYQAKGSY